MVSNAVNNTGTIESINGTLTLSGSLQNSAGGLITVDAGSKVLVSSGLASNYGIINLIGGSYDNNSHALTNYSEISGYGTLRTGGLTNHGSITLTGAVSTINGNLTNAADGTVNVSYNPVTFTGAMINNGYFKITGTTVTYAGSFSNNGTYLSDPATNNFASLAIGPAGLLEGGVGDQFKVTGSFANSGDIDLGGSSTMLVGNGAGTLTQSGGTLELGTSASLTSGLVQINGGILLADGPGALTTSSLVYDSSAASTYQGKLAGAGNSLTLDNPAALLVLTGSNTFGGGTFVTSGELLVQNTYSLQDGSNLTVGDGSSFSSIMPASNGEQIAPPAIAAVPEPGTILLVAGFGLLLILSRRQLVG